MAANKLLSPLKVSILSISLLTVMAGAVVTPGVAKIVEAFPETPQTIVQLTVTFPMVFIFIFSLIGGRLTDHFRKRTLVFVGLAFYLVGGVGAGFANSVYVLLIFRALLGMGIGFLAPLAQTLISDYFSGSERAQMMGFSTAVPNFACIIITFASGLLASINWRYMFGLYMMAFITLVIDFFLLKEPPAYEVDNENVKPDKRLPVRSYLIAGGAFIFMTFFYSVIINIALYMRNQGIGGADKAGIIMAELSLVAFFMGSFYSYLQKYLNDFLIPIGLSGFALNFYLLYKADTFSDVIISTIFLGIGYGITYPTIALKASHSVPQFLAGKALSLANSLLYLGQFLSPVIFGIIGFIAGDTSIRFLYQVMLGTSLTGLFIFFVVFLPGKLRFRKRAGSLNG